MLEERVESPRAGRIPRPFTSAAAWIERTPEVEYFASDLKTNLPDKPHCEARQSECKPELRPAR